MKESASLAASMKVSKKKTTRPMKIPKMISRYLSELPIAAATAVFITSVDGHTVGLVTSPAVASDSRKASNAAFAAEILLGAVPYVAGCAGGREHARRAGFAALEGMGYALGTAAVLKEAFNRQSPRRETPKAISGKAGNLSPQGTRWGPGGWQARWHTNIPRTGS